MDWPTIRSLVNWLVFGATIFYGLWVFFLLLGALFILGSNDTALEIVGILAAGLSPIPAALLALRHRKLAAFCLTASASLWIIGTIDGHSYLVKTFGDQIGKGDLFRFLIRTTCVPLALALFYAITDILGWPLLWPKRNNQRPVLDEESSTAKN